MRDRFFVEGVHAPGERVRFAADDARKIAVVLRKRTGDRVAVVDSGGRAFEATLEVGTGAVSALLERALERANAEAGVRIVLAQGIPKGQKMDLIVEKATELGVAAIVPLRSARVEGDRTGEHKRERWQRIAKSAAQQCGRVVVPDVAAVAGWPELTATFAAYDRVYLPWELADPAPLRVHFERDAAGVASVLLIVGPEGGFAADEVAAARDAGAIPLSLGRRILRTETAALVVLSALLYARGEL